MDLIRLILPEIVLIVAACALFLLGVSTKAGARRAAPVLALAALLAAFAIEYFKPYGNGARVDVFNTFRVTEFTHFIRMLTALVSVLFVLMSWPTDREATGNPALHFGADAGEFFGLLLLSVAGVFLVAGADDMILLFLGIELASIPTYIMVSVSRPLAVSQEAGVKYFFLGAMSAALMLFGFSYLYGTTGTTSLRVAAEMLAATAAGDSGTGPAHLTAWRMLAVLMLVAGFSFKIAAVPLHVYAADVYQGAATPVTALLSFIPKTSGMVALIKLLVVVGGGTFAVPITIAKLLWVLAVLTMTAGNVLGLLQFNVKRVLAYSSIAHSGYMLVGLATLAWAWSASEPGTAYSVQSGALEGVLFYLAAYGIMNAGAFGVLMLLPARPRVEDFGAGARPYVPPATSAETFDDLAGQGREHPALGLAMAICCFSLIGLPLTVGFFGKLYLIRPALEGGLFWLVVIMLVNAAISAAYYLKIVAAMFLRGEPRPFGPEQPTVPAAPTAVGAGRLAISLSVVLSVVGTLLFGTILPATQFLRNSVTEAARLDEQRPTPPADAVSAQRP